MITREYTSHRKESLGMRLTIYIVSYIVVFSYAQAEMEFQLQQKDTQLQQKDTQLQQKDTQLQQKDTQLQRQGTELRERALQISRQQRELQTLRVRNWRYIMYA